MSRFGSNHKIIEAPKGPCDKIRQVGATALGAVGMIVHVARTCSCNLFNAIGNRHGVIQPPVLRDFSNFKAAIALFAGPLAAGFIVEYSYWQLEWINRWSQAKRAAILASKAIDAIIPNKVKAFVKYEIMLKIMSKARGIQAYINLATQSLFGPEFLSMQKSLCTVMQRCEIFPGIRATIASGMNNQQLGDWLTNVIGDYIDPVFFESDGKNWDACMQAVHCDLKKYVYWLMLPDPVFQDFIQAGFDVSGFGFVKGSMRGVLRYRLNGTVKSGHNDTSLGNGINNVAIAAEACLALGLKCDILVTGDDLVIVVENVRGDFVAADLAKIMGEYGIIPEFRSFRDPAQIEFASGIWFQNQPGRFIYTPKPGKLLAKLFWSIKPPSQKRLVDHVYSIAVGHLPVCGGMPVIGSFLRAHAQRGNLISVRKCPLYDGVIEWDFDLVTQAFMKRYSVTMEDLLEADEFVAALPGGPCLMIHPVVQRIIAVDTADLLSRFADQAFEA